MAFALKPHPVRISTSLLARAVFLALCVCGPVLAQEAQPADVAPPEKDKPSSEVSTAPSETSSAAPEETPWIWVDLCIEKTEFCFSAVAAKPPEGDRTQWEVELTPENLKEASIDRGSLKVRTEDGLDWVLLDQAVFDESALSLSWQLPLESMEGQRFKTEGSNTLEEVSPAQHPWTMALDYSASYGNGFFVVGDIALGKKHTALLTNGSWSEGEDGFVRGLTRIEHDQPSRNLRWSAGEIVAFSPDPLGASTLMRGIGVARTFETSPTLITNARPNLSGVVDRSGTLEVYSNGQLVSSRPVRPGPYTLEQLGINAGRQNISIVLRDEAGNRKTLMQTSYYGSSELLAKGLNDFALRVGIAQEGALSDTTENVPPEKIAQAYWRRGITERLTMGVRADVGEVVQSYGLSAAFATPFGEFSTSFGTSSAGGSAYIANYFYSSNRMSIGLNHLKRDLDYRLPGEFIDINDEDRVLVSSGASASFAVIPRLNISVNANEDTLASGVKDQRTAVQVGGELFGSAQWSLMAQRQKRSDESEVNHSLSLMVSVPFGRRQNASFFANKMEEGSGYGMNFNQGRADEYGYSYGGNIQRSPTGITGGTVRADYQAQNALYALQVDQLGESRTVQGSVSGGLVLAGSNLFFTPPLGSGFAILKAPEAPDVPVVRENVPAGTTNSRGLALIRNLSPYYPSLVGFDPNKLPIDMSPGDVIAKRIVPTVHTATLVEFNASPVFAAQAHLVWPDKTDVHYGEIVFGAPLNQSVLIGKEGLLWIEKVQPGSYVGELTTEIGTGRCTLEIKQQTDAVQDLGQIICERLSSVPVVAPEVSPSVDATDVPAPQETPSP